MHLCNPVENDAVNASVGNGTLTASDPAALKIDFHLGDPGEDGTANPASGYTPPVITFGAPTAGSGSNRKIQNSSTHSVTFSGSVALTHFTIKDYTSGKVWCRGAFSATKNVPAAGTLDLAANDVQLEFSGDLSPTVQDGILNALRGNASFAPTACKVTLATGAPGTGVIANEMSGITRQSVTWNTAADGVISNNGAITFPTVSSQTADYVVIVRDSDGQVMWSDDVANQTDTDFRIPDGVMTVTLD